MGNFNWRRVLIYLGIWAIGFIVLVFISIIKNWSILTATISGFFSQFMVGVFMVIIIIFAIISLFRMLF